MEQVIDAIISSARSLVPDLDILSRADGLEELFEEQARELEQISDELEKLTKTCTKWRPSCKQWLHRAITKIRKLEAEEAQLQELDAVCIRSSKEVRREITALFAKKRELQTLYYEQSYKLENRTRAQKRVDEAYKAWFTGPIMPTFGVLEGGLAVDSLEKTIETLRGQLTFDELTERMLLVAEQNMESCLTRIKKIQALFLYEWINGHSHTYVLRKSGKNLLAAERELKAANSLVAQAHDLDAKIPTMPTIKGSLIMNNIITPPPNYIHDQLIQRHTTIYHLWMQAKDRTAKKKSLIASKTRSLAEAKTNLKKEQREVVRMLAKNEYLESLPPYVP